MEEKIERLAEINCAGTLMKLGEDLINEREIIVNYLKVVEVISVENDGGFRFISDDAEQHKKVYLSAFNNF